MLTRLLRLGLGALLTFTTLAGAQSWTRLPNAPGSGVNTSLLLTDGTVMAHTANTGTWWRLTEPGASTVQVVANGIPSNPAAILVVSCTRDSLGYCVVGTTGLLNGGRCLIAPRVVVNEHLGTIVYHILTPNGTIQDFTETVTDDGTGSCTTNESWSPGEPSVVFNDPHLP
jgi:hypothetical protein